MPARQEFCKQGLGNTRFSDSKHQEPSTQVSWTGVEEERNFVFFFGKKILMWGSLRAVSPFTHSSDSLLRKPRPTKPRVKMQARSHWLQQVLCLSPSQADWRSKAGCAAAKEQWASEPAQAKSMPFVGGRTSFNYFSSLQRWFSGNPNTVHFHLFGVKHLARDCMLFQTDRDTALPFHPSFNQRGYFPILIKSSVSAN